MNKMVKIFLLGILATFLVTSTSSALTITLEDLNTSDYVVIGDDLAAGIPTDLIIPSTHADLANPLPGSVAFTGAVGSWVFNLSGGISDPLLGTSTYPGLHLNNISASSSAGASLGILLVDTYADWDDLNAGIDGFKTKFGGVSGGTIDFTININGEEILYSTGSGAFSYEEILWSVPGVENEEFILSIYAEINHEFAGVSSFDAEVVSQVPEPASLVLLGVGLIGLAGITRRKIKA